MINIIIMIIMIAIETVITNDMEKKMSNSYHDRTLTK